MVVNCGNCAFKNENNYCKVFQQTITNVYNTSCPRHTVEIQHCDFCGAEVFKPNILAEADYIATICPECEKFLSTCRTCRQGQLCDFETNPSSLPKSIQKQIRQGNMVSVVQVKNPERVRETCEKNCKCYDKNLRICSKEMGYCNEYLLPELQSV